MAVGDVGARRPASRRDRRAPTKHGRSCEDTKQRDERRDANSGTEHRKPPPAPDHEGRIHGRALRVRPLSIRSAGGPADGGG